MRLNHILLLIIVAAIWGFNFVAIRLGLNHVPPIAFSAMRFFFAAFPAVFFVKKPDLPWKKLAAFGLAMFVGQFAFLFSGMKVGLSAGLASLVLQMQAFFTIGLAVFFLKEKPLSHQILGAIVSAAGICVIAGHAGGEVTFAGLIFVLLAALSWGCGNVMTKIFGKVDMFGLVVWGSLVACPILAGLAFIIEGYDAIRQSIAQTNATITLSLAYIVYISTFVGFTLWGRVLAQYSASMVAPFTLLVPAFGMLSAALILQEAYPLWKLAATLLIIVGLVINQFGKKFAVWIWRFRPNAYRA